MRVEIRCGCRPSKLLGWVEVPDAMMAERNVLTFIIPARADYARLVLDGMGAQTPARAVSLPVGRCPNHDGDGLILTSEETALELLLEVPGFEENPWPYL